MNICVVGGGEIATAVTLSLLASNHNVTMIQRSEEGAKETIAQQAEFPPFRHNHTVFKVPEPTLAPSPLSSSSSQMLKFNRALAVCSFRTAVGHISKPMLATTLRHHSPQPTLFFQQPVHAVCYCVPPSSLKDTVERTTEIIARYNNEAKQHDSTSEPLSISFCKGMTLRKRGASTEGDHKELSGSERAYHLKLAPGKPKLRDYALATPSSVLSPLDATDSRPWAPEFTVSVCSPSPALDMAACAQYRLNTNTNSTFHEQIDEEAEHQNVPPAKRRFLQQRQQQAKYAMQQPVPLYVYPSSWATMEQRTRFERCFLHSFGMQQIRFMDFVNSLALLNNNTTQEHAAAAAAGVGGGSGDLNANVGCAIACASTMVSFAAGIVDFCAASSHQACAAASVALTEAATQATVEAVAGLICSRCTNNNNNNKQQQQLRDEVTGMLYRHGIANQMQAAVMATTSREYRFGKTISQRLIPSVSLDFCFGSAVDHRYAFIDTSAGFMAMLRDAQVDSPFFELVYAALCGSQRANEVGNFLLSNASCRARMRFISLQEQDDSASPTQNVRIDSFLKDVKSLDAAVVDGDGDKFAEAQAVFRERWSTQ